MASRRKAAQRDSRQSRESFRSPVWSGQGTAQHSKAQHRARKSGQDKIRVTSYCVPGDDQSRERRFFVPHTATLRYLTLALTFGDEAWCYYAHLAGLCRAESWWSKACLG